MLLVQLTKRNKPTKLGLLTPGYLSRHYGINYYLHHIKFLCDMTKLPLINLYVKY